MHAGETIYALEIGNNEPGYSIVAVEYHILGKPTGNLYEKENFLILRRIENASYGTSDSFSPMKMGAYILTYNSETKKIDFWWKVAETTDFYEHYTLDIRK